MLSKQTGTANAGNIKSKVFEKSALLDHYDNINSIRKSRQQPFKCSALLDYHIRTQNRQVEIQKVAKATDIPSEFVVKTETQVRQQYLLDQAKVEQDWKKYQKVSKWITGTVTGAFRVLKCATSPLLLVAEVVGGVALQTVISNTLTSATGLDSTSIGVIGQISSVFIITSIKVLPTLVTKGSAAAGKQLGWSFVASVKTMALTQGSSHYIGESYGYLVGSVVDETLTAVFVGKGTSFLFQQQQVPPKLAWVQEQAPKILRGCFIAGLVTGLTYGQLPTQLGESISQYLPAIITRSQVKVIWNILQVSRLSTSNVLIQSSVHGVYNAFLGNFIRTQADNIIQHWNLDQKKVVPLWVRQRLEFGLLERTIYLWNYAHVLQFFTICVNVASKAGLATATNQGYQKAQKWSSLEEAYKSMHEAIDKGKTALQEMLTSIQTTQQAQQLAFEVRQKFSTSMKDQLQFQDFTKTREAQKRFEDRQDFKTLLEDQLQFQDFTKTREDQKRFEDRQDFQTSLQDHWLFQDLKKERVDQARFEELVDFKDFLNQRQYENDTKLQNRINFEKLMQKDRIKEQTEPIAASSWDNVRFPSVARILWEMKLSVASLLPGSSHVVELAQTVASNIQYAYNLERTSRLVGVTSDVVAVWRNPNAEVRTLKNQDTLIEMKNTANVDPIKSAKAWFGAQGLYATYDKHTSVDVGGLMLNFANGRMGQVFGSVLVGDTITHEVLNPITEAFAEVFK